MDEALQFDRRHLWRPYAGMREPGPVHHVVEAEGVWLTLADGARMIDAMSSWWCAAHGHRHPQIAADVLRAAQAAQLVEKGGHVCGLVAIGGSRHRCQSRHRLAMPGDGASLGAYALQAYAISSHPG